MNENMIYRNIFNYDFGSDEVIFDMEYSPHPTGQDIILSWTYQGYKKSWGSTIENIKHLRDDINKLLLYIEGEADMRECKIVRIPDNEEIYFGEVLQERYGQPLTGKHVKQLQKILDMIEFLNAYNFSCVVDTNKEMTKIYDGLKLLKDIVLEKLQDK